MMTAKAGDVAQKYLDFLDSEKPAPSSRWLNLVNLLESFAAEARNEALDEAADKIKLWEIASEIVLSLKSKPESGGKV